MDAALMCGGSIDGRPDASITAACSMYNASADAWTTAPSLNTARAGHSMAVCKGARTYSRTHAFCAGRVLVYGGVDVKGNIISSVEVLSSADGKWQQLPAPLYQPDYSFASVPFL
jgi:hypothetical protein